MQASILAACCGARWCHDDFSNQKKFFAAGIPSGSAGPFLVSFDLASSNAAKHAGAAAGSEAKTDSYSKAAGG